ncbi:MAG: hypothetical protein HY289_12950 [Planctomycetes bacterium]|nr:hypothetical protein [Planctomycetota bacterium]
MRWIVFLLLIAAGCKRPAPNDPPQTDEQAKEKPAAKPKEVPVTPPKLSIPTAGWTPNAKLLDKLDAPMECFGYTIRSPKGWEKTHSKFAAELFPVPRETMEWHTGYRKDANRTTVSIDVIQPEKPTRSEDQVKAWLDLMQKLDAKFPNDWSHAPIETGKLDGLSFLRVRHTSKETRGIRYAADDGDRMIRIDVEVSNASASGPDELDLAHTAAMTFKRKGPN